MSNDHGYTAERCKSGLAASEALMTTTGERKFWAARAEYWQRQLKHAERRRG